MKGKFCSRRSHLSKKTRHVLVVSLAIITLIALSNALALTQPLNDTGITKCGDYAYDGGSGVHNNDVDCSLTVDADGDPVPPGQDGHYGRDVTHNDDSDGHAGFSFTKVDSCVVDNVTGLMWEVKTDDGGLRDKDWTYTWYNSDSSTNGGIAGTQNGGSCYGSSNCDTEKYTARVNAAGLCSFSDWRLPGREELRSIIDYSIHYPGPRIDAAWFPNTVQNSYWSASPATSGGSWTLHFGAGWDAEGYKYAPAAVRLVRGGELASASTEIVGCRSNISVTTPTSNFLIHGNATLTDGRTGLMWKQCVEGLSGAYCQVGSAIELNWKASLDHAAASSFAYYEDWRLPNIKEMASIVELSCRSPAINLEVFPNTGSNSQIWTTSPNDPYSNTAWDVKFNNGSTYPYFKRGYTQQVRLVRSGQSGFSPGDLSASILSDKKIYRPDKNNTFTVTINNQGDTFVTDAEVTITHDPGFIPSSFHGGWKCSNFFPSLSFSCTEVSEETDGSGVTTAIFRVSLAGHSNMTITGHGEFANDRTNASVLVTVSGGTPADPDQSNNSATKTINGFPPTDLPGTQDAMLCDSAGNCNDAVSVDVSKPTIVLTHGLQNTDCPRNNLWTAFRSTPPGGGYLLEAFFAGNEVNVLQYHWNGACQAHQAVTGLPNDTAYIQARQNVYHAGKVLANKLKALLASGGSYTQKIQFIGHSLGTGVNAYAAKIFLEEVAGIPEAQVTILDYPNRVSKIIWMSDKDEKLYGFDRNFFAEVLPFELLGDKLKVDNYYSKKGGLFDTKLSGEGVGTKISAPQSAKVFNRELAKPLMVGELLLGGEAALLFIDNDHSGVHQWYRWTMLPNEYTDFSGTSVCFGTEWNLRPFLKNTTVLMGAVHHTLDPCLYGWHFSIMQNPDGPYPFPTTSNEVPNPSTAVDLEFVEGIGNNCTFNEVAGAILCNESVDAAPDALQSVRTAAVTTPPVVSYLDATMTVPVNARYLTFDYRFTNVGDGDYVYLLVDDKPVWKMSGDAVTQGEWNESGPITIAMEPGENTFVVALFGVGAQNAQFEMKNFQFIEVLPTFADVPPAHPNYESVEVLADNSVVEGCNTDDGLFCPNQTLTRDTLAMWLMKAKMGESYVPAPATGLFDDVPTTSPFANWIDAFSNEGYTEGCDTNRYCPTAPVDKAQLAKLLLMILNGTGYTPDTATGDIFDDISVFDFNADWIEDAVQKGLLEGCGYKQFCPNEILIRSAMARIVENVF